MNALWYWSGFLVGMIERAWQDVRWWAIIIWLASIQAARAWAFVWTHAVRSAKKCQPADVGEVTAVNLRTNIDIQIRYETRA